MKRYWTSELRSMVTEFQECKERREICLASAFEDILELFSEHKQVLLEAINSISIVDCCISLYKASNMLGNIKCRPNFIEQENAYFRAREMRHPTASLSCSSFISNDIELGSVDSSNGSNFILLTGANMGGKSTLLRQSSLLVLMAHIGMHVPATECTLTVVDQLFTRIGANDNILQGKSTFLVEMEETSKILLNATNKSFVILDELGRGTSTVDGSSIAFAVLDDLSKRCLGLFSTHYHQLTEEFASSSNVRLMHMACEVGEQVIFLYKLQDGVCPKSYGTNVALMAGISREIVEDAEKIQLSVVQEFKKLFKK